MTALCGPRNAVTTIIVAHSPSLVQCYYLAFNLHFVIGYYTLYHLTDELRSTENCQVCTLNVAWTVRWEILFMKSFSVIGVLLVCGEIGKWLLSGASAIRMGPNAIAVITSTKLT